MQNFIAQQMVMEMLGAVAYVAMAFALHDFYVATEPVLLRWRLGLVALLLLAGALVQVGMLLAGYFGQPAAVAFLQGLAGVCLAGVAAAFWPVVARLKRRRVQVVNRRLLQRVQRAEAAAVAARGWLDLAEQSGHVGHWQLMLPENRLVWSDEMFRIHGLWRAHYVPRLQSALAAFHPADGRRVAALLQEMAARRERLEVAARLRRPDGEIRHVILRGSAALGAAGEVMSLQGVMVDVTEPRRAEARLLPHAALRDLPLEDNVTGLADRRQFDLSLGYEFKRAVRSRKPLGLVLVEIDQFDSFCAHYGALEGDACLRAVAQAVQAVPRRTGDVVARHEGTRIAVLLPLADAAGARRVAAQILEAIRALALSHAGAVASPHAGQGERILSVSCGAAAFVGMEDLYNPLELTRRANHALGEAKAAGGGRVAGYDEVVYSAAARWE
jgi:diguanylate cyclase (GGDEF)-like protein